MTSLTDTQLIVLNAAAQRSSLLALPLPPKLKGIAAHKVIHPLIEEGLLDEVDVDLRFGAPVWRGSGHGHGVTLAITQQGSLRSASRPTARHRQPTSAMRLRTPPTLRLSSKVRQQPPQRLPRANPEAALNRRPSSKCCTLQKAPHSPRSLPPRAGRTTLSEERSLGR